MATLRRLSHIGFNVPRELFDKECEFWEKVMGLTYVHGDPGRNAFFTADLLRDHEFILYAVDEPVPTSQLNHLAFDVATDADVSEFTARLRAHGYDVDEPANRGRRQNKVTSPAGIHFEVNTPPYTKTNTPAAEQLAPA